MRMRDATAVAAKWLTLRRSAAEGKSRACRSMRQDKYGMRVVAWVVAMHLGVASIGGSLQAENHKSNIEVVVVVGAPGENEYGERHSVAEALWRGRCAEAGAGYRVIGLAEDGEGKSDLELLREEVELFVNAARGELWIILIGHGTFDGREAKFNLRGPDLSAAELAEWLESRKDGLVVVNCASSSGPFLPALSGPGRVVITATKSGNEVFYASFGEHFAEAIGEPEADFDEDGQTSLLESFLMAGREVALSYEERGLLATEHALIDDNGDRQGTRRDAFQGVRAKIDEEEEGDPDGFRAHQRNLIPSALEWALPAEMRQKRDALELQVRSLQRRKGKLMEEDYYERLEVLFLEIAALYREVKEGKSVSEPDPAAAR